MIRGEKCRNISTSNEKGSALVIVVLLVAVIVMLSTTAVLTSTTDMKISRNYLESQKAFYNADAGVIYAIGMMKAGLEASPQTFTLPGNIGDTSTLAYTVPSGFSFSISDITKVAENTYAFSCTGNSPSNSHSVIQARFSKRGGRFNYGVFANGQINFSGNASIDSYDSSLGTYAQTKGSDGDVGTNGTAAGIIQLSGNAKITRDAIVGPKGDAGTGIQTSGNAAVVGKKLVASESKDMSAVAFPTGGISETFATTKTLSDGTYLLPSISLSGNNTGTISGKVTLYVTGNISISGNAQMNILSGGSLTIYAAGSVSISGNGIINKTLVPSNLVIYGTSTCTSVSISGNGDLVGAIYAPNAAASITGNGSIYGSIISSTMNDSGNGSIHYDKALQKLDGSSTLKLLSWKHDI